MNTKTKTKYQVIVMSANGEKIFHILFDNPMTALNFVFEQRDFYCNKITINEITFEATYYKGLSTEEKPEFGLFVFDKEITVEQLKGFAIKHIETKIQEHANTSI